MNTKVTKDTKVTTTKVTTTKDAFTALLRDYEKATQDRQQRQTAKTETAYTKALTDLSKAIAYSVVKKCLDVSQNKTLLQIRQSIARDTNLLDRIKYASENAYSLAYNEDGDVVRKVEDKDSAKALNKLCTECFGDGLDIVSDAMIAIMSETEKIKDTSVKNFMEVEYSVRRLNKKVWIKREDSINGFETVMTTPIQEVYRTVRRSIDNSRAIQTDPKNGYSYIEDYATDNESNAIESIYRRMAKYADLGGYEKDFNNACTVYTIDTETVTDTNDIIGKMQLTEKQAKVLQLRQCGYGEKAIATYLGVTKQAIQKTLKQIQVKALAIGLQPTK